MYKKQSNQLEREFPVTNSLSAGHGVNRRFMVSSHPIGERSGSFNILALDWLTSFTFRGQRYVTSLGHKQFPTVDLLSDRLQARP